MRILQYPKSHGFEVNYELWYLWVTSFNACQRFSKMQIIHIRYLLCTYPCNTNPKVPSQYILIFLTLVISLGQKWSQIVLRANEIIIKHADERVNIYIYFFFFWEGVVKVKGWDVIFFGFLPWVSKFGDFFSLAKLVDFTNEKIK
jgi:hypothetical protein